MGETLVRQGRSTPVDLKRAVGFALLGRASGSARCCRRGVGLIDAPALEEAVTIQAHQVLEARLLVEREAPTSSWRSRQIGSSTVTSRSGCRPAS